MKADNPSTRFVTRYDEDDSRPSNIAPGMTFSELVAIRVSRRGMLRSATAAGLIAALGAAPAPSVAAVPKGSLGFAEIPHAYDEKLHVPDGYVAQTLIGWGDPVASGSPSFDPRSLSPEAQARQFGYNCDFVKFMPLPEGSQASDHGLLFVNHEYTNAFLMFPGFTDEEAALAGTDAAMAAIEMEAHGASVIEVIRDGGTWKVVANSPFSRRISVGTPIEIAGPAAGHARLATSADPTGKLVVGMLNNCGGGWTPWGTILSAEENFNGYFGGDPAGTAEAVNHKRYGMKGEPWYAWHKFEPRFDVTKEPNEPNRFGWVVEIDPYEPGKPAIKRTALGRLKHEAATTVLNHDGRLVVYTGDDERFEYVYKYVSTGTFDPAKGKANSSLLDEGTLFVARFAANGAMEWLALAYGKGPLTEANGFSTQAELLIEARRAADLLGATKMDRPEDIEASPVTGKVYVVLTKNDKRKADQLDGANARPENKWGQLVELTPPDRGGKPDHAATRFAWDVFIQAGDPSDLAHQAIYGGDVGTNGWFANPDNVAFDGKGRLWIATDGFPDHGVHDGLWTSDTEGEGRAMTRHFLGCPQGAELCGPELTPDGTTLFVAIQHPGDEKGSNFDAPSTRWPDFKDDLPPRPAVVAITRAQGGEIGG